MLESSAFNLDEKTYKQRFYRHTRRRGFFPKYLVQFVIELPFDIPISQFAYFTKKLKDGNEAIIDFSRKEYPIILLNGNDIEEVPFKYKKSRVEMTYVMVDTIDSKEIEGNLSTFFDILLEPLNTFILSYVLTTTDASVYRITREMLSPIGFFRIVQIDTWENIRLTIFNISTNFIGDKEQIHRSQFEDMLRIQQIIYKKKNPFIFCEEIVLDSKRNFQRGLYKEAVIHANTAIESFLMTLWREVLIIEGANSNEVETKLANVLHTGFINMVKREFHTYLGGYWDINDSTKPIGDWFKKTYILRNKIVHSGYYPTYEEVSEALEAAGNFRLSIFSLLNASNRYEKIKFYFSEIV